MEMQEIEVRGPLNKRQFEEFHSWLRKNAEFKGKKRRLLIDFTPFSTNKKLDVRARITNGKAEIIVKRGKWLAENRKETSVYLEKGNFRNALEVLGNMGYKKGILALRNFYRYVYRNIDFSLVEVIKVDKKLKETPGFSFYYEAELLNPGKDFEREKKSMNRILLELGLQKFNREELVGYVENVLNPKCNIPFDIDEFDLNLIREN